MKKWAVLLVCSLATVAGAAERSSGVAPVLGQPVLGQVPPSPVPDTSYAAPSTAPVVVATPVALYCNVRYKDQRNIAPCAVPTIVQVPDPCDPCCCVSVQICVPPCECPCVKVSKCGRKVSYDYGKYQVEITSARGRVTVDYDD